MDNRLQILIVCMVLCLLNLYWGYKMGLQDGFIKGIKCKIGRISKVGK